MTRVTWPVGLFLVFCSWMAPPGAKQLFYDAGRSGAIAAADDAGLRPITIAPHEVNGGGRLPVGMHLWLETESGVPISQRAASQTPGQYSLHVRHNNEVPAAS